MQKKAIYSVILAALIGGGNGVLIKEMSSLSVGAIAWFRATVPLLFLLPIIFSKANPLFKGNYKKMLLASAINAIRIYFYLMAFVFTTIGNAVIIFYSYPIFVYIIEMSYLKATIKKEQIGLMLLAFVGLIFTYSDKTIQFENSDFIGMTAAIIAAIGYSITVILFKSETKNYNNQQIIVYQNLISAFVFIPFLLFLSEVKPEHLAIGVGYGFLIGIVVFKLFFFGLTYLTATTSSSLMYLEVVSAVFLGCFLLDETLNINTIIGGSLIIISSYCITKKSNKKIN